MYPSQGAFRGADARSATDRLAGAASRIVVPFLLLSSPLCAQDVSPDSWNAPRALQLVERGREARQRLATHEGLQSYRAETRGHVYFYLDPEEGGERPLLRIDQVAVDLYWMSPNRTRQIIVGHREEKLLPIRDFQYFLDRLTLVQYGLGDRIRVGEGMDVRDAPHPLAPTHGSEPRYDYRLVDSVTVQLPGGTEPIRVYEIDVRPREPSEPAVVGAIHLDRASGSLVRMDFTFTPASYVDPRNDRVRISLEYGLWEGQYWLPHEQTVEVRRELPQLDLGVGTIILAVLRTGNYELNLPLEPDFFMAPRVTALPREQLEAFSFDDDPLDVLRELGRAGGVRQVDGGELHRRAREILGREYTSGLPSVRLHLPGASSALRFNRAEGWRVGAGVAFRPRPFTDVRLTGGYAFGPGRPSLRAEAEFQLPADARFRIEGMLHEVLDIGPHPGADGVLNTLSSLTRGVDYLDPYARDGAAVSLRRVREGAWQTSVHLGFERHSPLPLSRPTSPFDAGRTFRPVRDVDETNLGTVRLGITRRDGAPLPGAGEWEAAMEVGRWSDETFTRLLLSATSTLQRQQPRTGVELGLRGGLITGTPPLQRHFLLGGRHTIPGFPYRSFAGRRYLQGRVLADTPLLRPWLHGRAGLWGGWSGDLPAEVGERWGTRVTDGPRFGVTIGAGVLYDLLRVDLARGVPSGEWQLLLYLDPTWWERL